MFLEKIGCKVISEFLDANADLERGLDGGRYEELYFLKKVDI